MGQIRENPRSARGAEWGRSVSERTSGNRYAWLQDEDEPRVEEALRDDAPVGGGGSAPGPSAGRAATAPIEPPVGRQAGVPGISRPRRRNRAKNPKALRNDPDRMMAGARIRKDVRRRVEQALADPEVGEGTNYSLLVESLLVRWLDEVGYPQPER